MRPDTVMHIIQRRQDTPTPINLRVIPIDLAHNQEDRTDEE